MRTIAASLSAGLVQQCLWKGRQNTVHQQRGMLCKTSAEIQLILPIKDVIDY